MAEIDSNDSFDEKYERVNLLNFSSTPEKISRSKESETFNCSKYFRLKWLY